MLARRQVHHGGSAGLRIRVAVRRVIAAAVLRAEIVAVRRNELHEITAGAQAIEQIMPARVRCRRGNQRAALSVQIDRHARNRRLSGILRAVAVIVRPDVIAERRQCQEAEINRQVRVRIAVFAGRLIAERQRHHAGRHALCRQIRRVNAVFIRVLVAVAVRQAIPKRRNQAGKRLAAAELAGRNMDEILAFGQAGKQIIPVLSRDRRRNRRVHARRISGAIQFDRHARDALFAAVLLAIVRRAAVRAVIQPDAVAETEQRVIFDFAVRRFAGRRRRLSCAFRKAETRIDRRAKRHGRGWRGQRQRIRAGRQRRIKRDLLARVKHAVPVEIDPRIQIAVHRRLNLNRKRLSRHNRRQEFHAVFIIVERLIVAFRRRCRFAVAFRVHAHAHAEERHVIHDMARPVRGHRCQIFVRQIAEIETDEAEIYRQIRIGIRFALIFKLIRRLSPQCKPD